MAKKQTTSTGLGNALIQGAAAVYGTQNQPVAVNTDYSALAASLENRRAEKRAALANEESKAANMLGQLETMDIGIVPTEYRDKTEGALKNLRDQYYETVQALRGMKTSDDQYLDLVAQKNNINNSIKNIASTWTDLAANRKEDLEFISGQNYSAGNNPNKISFVNSVLTNQAELEYDENGKAYFKDGENWRSYENLPDITPYAATSFDSILTDLDNVSKIGRQLTDIDKRVLQGKIDKILKTGGRNAAISLGADDFIIPGGMGIVDAEAEYDADPRAYREKIINNYMGLFEDTANESYKREQAKLAAKQKPVQPKQWEMKLQADAQLYNQIQDFAKSGKSANPKQIITLANQLTKDGTFTTGYNLAKSILAQNDESTDADSIKEAMKMYNINPNSLYKNNDNSKEYPIEPQYLQSTLLELAGISPRRQAELQNAFGQQTTQQLTPEQLIAKYSK